MVQIVKDGGELPPINAYLGADGKHTRDRNSEDLRNTLATARKRSLSRGRCLS
jgi:hypothetical protein